MPPPPTFPGLAGDDAQRRLSYCLLCFFPVLTGLHLIASGVQSSMTIPWFIWSFGSLSSTAGLGLLLGSDRTLAVPRGFIRSLLQIVAASRGLKVELSAEHPPLGKGSLSAVLAPKPPALTEKPRRQRRKSAPRQTETPPPRPDPSPVTLETRHTGDP